MLNYEMINI